MSLGAMGAGAAGALEDLLKQKFFEQIQRAQMAQGDRRLQMDEARQREQAEYNREALASLKESRADAAQARSQAGALRLAGTMAPGAELDDASVSALQGGDLGNLIEHKDATLGSTNYSGAVDTAGKAPRVVGLAKTANPGQDAKNIFKGTAAQQQAQAQREALERLAATSDDPRLRQFLEAQQAGVDLPNELLKGPEKVAKPASVQEYEYAKSQGYTGSFQQYQTEDANRKRSLVTVNTGGTNAPGQSPYAKERNVRNLQSVEELLKQVSPWTTGAGSLLSNIPATDARNFKAQLDTLKANIAFGELAAMREASKTGGALGQVSNIELKLLGSALGALDAGMSPSAFEAQLQKVRDSIQRWEAAAAKAGGAGGRGSAPGGGRGGGAGQIRYDINGEPIKK